MALPTNLSPAMPFSHTRFEIQGDIETYPGSTRTIRVAVFDRLEDAEAFRALPELLAAFDALLLRYEHDGVPNDSRPFIDRALRARAKVPA